MNRKEVVAEFDQLLSALGPVRSKPMFGGHGAYVNEKFAAIYDDDRLFIKLKGVPDDVVDRLFGNREQPYEGAKNYAEADPTSFENAEWVAELRAELIRAKLI